MQPAQPSKPPFELEWDFNYGLYEKALPSGVKLKVECKLVHTLTLGVRWDLDVRTSAPMYLIGEVTGWENTRAQAKSVATRVASRMVETFTGVAEQPLVEPLRAEQPEKKET